MHAGGPRLHSGGACRRRLAHQFRPLRGTRQLRRPAAQPGRATCGGGTHAGSPAVLGKPPSAATACACGCNPGCNPMHPSCKPVYPGEPAAADRWAGRRLFYRDGCMAHPAIRCARRCSWFKMAPAFGGHTAALWAKVVVYIAEAALKTQEALCSLSSSALKTAFPLPTNRRRARAHRPAPQRVLRAGTLS